MPVPENPFDSVLWLDNPGAEERIAAAERVGQIRHEDAGLLRKFRSDGFILLHLEGEMGTLDELVDDVGAFWKRRPDDLLFAHGRPVLRRMSTAEEAEDRQHGYRISDAHSHSRAARRLYLHPKLHSIARLLLGEPAVAIQSLFFEFGSGQALHRDPVFVQTHAAGHLTAAWIALEDVDPEAGPLVYVPGSHRLPPYEFSPGVYRFDPRHAANAENAAESEQHWLSEQMRERGLERTVFTPRKGDVLFWHAGLYHGGDWIRNPALTRRSFVVHYSTRRTHHVVATTVLETSPAGEEIRIYGTHRQIQDGHAVGFASPVARSQFDLWPTLRNRLASIGTEP